ncbi:hypothetical protein KIH27_12830 [Mycobacterium sp. M1]|uniref:Secreted protein n=1 Tax=Mycolicibacter acidiphilus TaxID=2835306 RepID=A0ABS5RLW1_9MYCO|nr:hypothetical protein [Mycolicibacter acidiphilus]MBS9534471.1 hypothetical protein [Mycolicibacter acidiphilus]
MVNMRANTIRRIAALATAVGAAVALTPAAGANPGEPAPEGTVEGVYTFSQGGARATWEITPLCVPTVGDGRVPINTAIGCKLQVVSDGKLGQSGLYRLSGGRWLFSKPLLAGMKCPDGKIVATQETYEFDTGLNGLYTQAHNAVCGEAPGLNKQPFTLTYVGPLPFPVEHYPLNCMDNPLHMCS